MRQGIATVTMNPALDLTGQLSCVQIGEVNSIRDFSLRPAGKGVNVSCVLADMNVPVAATGILGDENAQAFNTLCTNRNIQDEFLVVPGSTRINVKISADQITEFNFPGLEFGDSVIHQLENTIERLLPDFSLWVVSGSLPACLPRDYYFKLISHLKAHGKKVLFDSSGLPFAEGIKAKPWLIKPNANELAEWAGFSLESPEAQIKVARELIQGGITHVVISNGAQGVLWVTAADYWQAQPPKVDVISTVGAGDTLVAGIAYGVMKQETPEVILRRATALSACAVMQVGVGVKDYQQVEQISHLIKLKQQV
ncbi:1-phosphofructokinase [Zooshikella ganghwensis]|uniref:1-phosphofructokinase n=1 Tax=Zooshikella ganghwensis TaxID=202772 RepID=UPI000429A166|nr:1-phosphofructokinase [Zooshikella ganghwensis]